MKTGKEPLVVWEPRHYTQMIPVCQRCRIPCELEDIELPKLKILATWPNCKRSEVVYDRAKIEALLKRTKPKARNA